MTITFQSKKMKIKEKGIKNSWIKAGIKKLSKRIN